MNVSLALESTCFKRDIFMLEYERYLEGIRLLAYLSCPVSLSEIHLHRYLAINIKPRSSIAQISKSGSLPVQIIR